MKLQKLLTFILACSFSFTATQTLAGAFIGADDSFPNLVLHPSNYTGSGGILNVNVCISPASADTAALEIPVQNVITVMNGLQPTTGNLLFGGNNNIPTGQFDAESVLLHEAGHCIGLAHSNLATESGLPDPDRNYTKSTTGNNGVYNLNFGADGIRGSEDDIRGDDTNLHWFHMLDNNPFTLAGVVDSTTYSRNLADLPSGTYAANGDRTVSALLGVPNTEAVMQQGQGVDEAQRTLAADDVATLLYGASGVDEVAGTSDDYTINLVYQGVTTSNCDVTISVDNSASFAFCSVGFSSVSGDHFRVSSGEVRLASDINWFYNQVSVDGPTNLSPIITQLTMQSVNENEFLSIPLVAADPNASDTLSFSTSGLPGFCTLIDNGDGTGAINCSPTNGDAADYTITVTATDDGDPVLDDSTTFTLKVIMEGVSTVTQCKFEPFAIPDDNPAGISDSLNFSNSATILDVNVQLLALHTYIGDLIFTIENATTGTIVTLIDRPGVPDTQFGCAEDNIDIFVDDEGADGNTEDTCNASPNAMTGSLTPSSPLTAFDGENVNGTWVLTASDSVGQDTGDVIGWCVEASVMEITETDTDGDGVFDSVDNCTLEPNTDQRDTNGDGIGNACDADIDNNCSVNFLDIFAFSQAFDSSTGDPNYDEDIDLRPTIGAINFLDFIVFPEQFISGVPGPSANECIPAD